MSRSNNNISENIPGFVAAWGEFRRVTTCGWLVLAFTGLVLGVFWSWVLAAQWLIQAGLLWALVTCQARGYLPLNRKSSEAALYPGLGLANQLTILRGWLIACTGGFLFNSHPPGPSPLCLRGFIEKPGLSLAFFLSLLGWGGMIFEIWLLLGFFAIQLGLTGLVLLVVAMRLAFLLPLPGGVGTLEAAIIWAFSALGLPLTGAAAVIAMMRLRDIVVLLVGLFSLGRIHQAGRSGRDN